MRVVYGCTIFLLWTVVSSAHGATTKKETEILSTPTNNQPVAIETAPLLPSSSSLSSSPGKRNKRQQDSNTAFVGLSIQKGAQAEDYARVKSVAGRVRRNASQRRRRSLRYAPPDQVWTQQDELLWQKNIRRPSFSLYIAKALGPRRRKPIVRKHKSIVLHQHHHHKVYVPIPVTQKPTRATQQQRLLTRTQETFNVINQNSGLSRNLREEYVREFNNTVVPASGGNIDPSRVQAANRLVVVRENGIGCNDVCDRSQGDSLGYGTIGICTPRFCQCDFNLGRYTRFDCPADMVFDPILLTCNSPFNVVLCNDEEFQEPQQQQYVKLLKPVLAVPKYVLTSPVVTTPVAPLSFATVGPPSLLANSFGNSGIQAVATPTPATYTVVPTQASYPVSTAPSPYSTIVPPVSTTASPVTYYSTTASPTSTLSSSQVIAGQQVQFSPLTQAELQSVNQLSSRQILPSDQYSIQQVLRSSQLNLQQHPALSQFAYSTHHPTPGSVSSVEKQRAYGPAQQLQVVQKVVSAPQQFVTVQQQPFVTVQQQQYITPTATPTTVLSLLTQTGMMNEIMQLSPNQVVQLAEVVKVLANNNRHSGTMVKTEVSAGKTVRGGYN